MIRLIAFIIVSIIFLAFIVLNLNNKCDISFGFKTFQEIPVFVSTLFSFVLGLLFTLPLAFSLRRGRKKPPKNEASDLPSGGKKKRWGKKDNTGSQDTVGKSTELSVSDDYIKEKSPYGID